MPALGPFNYPSNSKTAVWLQHMKTHPTLEHAYPIQHTNLWLSCHFDLGWLACTSARRSNSSFAEEAAAIQLALEWATDNHPEHSLTICTGSQSLLKAIERRSQVTHHLRSLLNARQPSRGEPGHKGIPVNEFTGTEAKIAVTTTSGPPAYP